MAPVNIHTRIRRGQRPAPARVATVPTTRSVSWEGLVIPLLLTVLLLAIAGAVQAQVAINTTGAAPTTPNAMLEISTTNFKGMLAPRMTYAERNLIPSPPDGLLIYQTDDQTTNVKGYYYYDSQTVVVGWRHISEGATWQLGGNAGTTSADFVGTLNAQPLNFRTRDYERARISATGQFQMYVLAPPAGNTELVHVEGAVKLNGGSVAPDQEGTIRYMPGSGTDPGRFEGYVVNVGPPVDPTLNSWKQIDNNFGERKNQETADALVGCLDPTASNAPFAAGNVPASPRPWPIPGPAGPYGSIGNMDARSPYFTYWEDSRRQYLYKSEDLLAAGICPGVGNPIRAIAFNAVGVSGAAGRIHFLRFRMKNTTATALTTFDDASLVDFANPSPPPGTNPPTYIVRGAPGFHTDGYTINAGWNIHPFNDGIAPYDNTVGFGWTGGNLLIDAAIDNQEWTGPSIQSAGVESYNTNYSSMLSMYCDACGGTGTTGSCKWQNTALPAGFYYPPTTPNNGVQGTNANVEGWSWRGGWTMIWTQSLVVCDGSTPLYEGSKSTAQTLPRVAFLAKYVGGGVAFKVGNYMVADEGLMVGDATWAVGANNFKGPGTLSAERSVWSGSTLLNDYVFDLYYDGEARPEDASSASRYMRTPLKELPNYVERERRLPTIDGREQWNKQGAFSVDKLGNQLWITVEDQALYIQELNARMDALKQYLVEKKLKELGGE